MIKRIKGRALRIYWDAKISSKITFFNSLLFGCLAVFLLISNNILAQYLAINYASNNAKQSSLIIQEKIEYLMSNSEDMAALIDNNDIIQKRLLANTTRERMDRIYPMANILNKTVSNSTGISTIVLYPTDWSTPITSTRVNLDKLPPEPSEQMKLGIDNYENMISWSDMHICDYQIFNDDRATITLKRSIVSIYTGQIVGFLVIDITENRISESYKDELDNGSMIMIINRNGYIVSSADKELLLQNVNDLNDKPLAEARTKMPLVGLQMIDEIAQKGYHIYSAHSKRYLVNVTRIEALDWSIVRFTPLTSIYEQTRGISITSFFIALIVLIIAALCVRRIATSLTKPLMELSQIMEEDPITNGRLLSVPGNDEVGRLNKSFQRMRLNMQILIERIKHEQHQQMLINMASLQTQINPHFLYNTLESVCSLLQIGRVNDASHMLKNIELFYRGTLSKGNTIISIRDEIFVTEQFFHIQQYRYDGNLRVNINISEDILSSCIPKLTLQPIVENSIYHGLKNGGKDGYILISEEHDANDIVISITDNGVGFEPMPFDAPQHGFSRGGFGLYNTQRRIKYYFGEEYGLQIQSKVGYGTTVCLRIPNRRIKESEGLSI